MTYYHEGNGMDDTALATGGGLTMIGITPGGKGALQQPQDLGVDAASVLLSGSLNPGMKFIRQAERVVNHASMIDAHRTYNGCMTTSHPKWHWKFSEETEALARQILTEEPTITGTALGLRLGYSGPTGCALVRKVGRPTVSPVERFPGPTLSQQYPHLMLPIARLELSRGMHAIIDPEDLEFVSQTSWFADKRRNGKWYARTNTRYPDVAGRSGPATPRLHVVIMGIVEVDHANGNGLDNRRCNLRAATPSMNMANRGKTQPGTSQFKGVSWGKREKKWRGQISVNGRYINLGTFASEVEAALAYDAAALGHFGEFALTNRMLGLLPPESRVS